MMNVKIMSTTWTAEKVKSHDAHLIVNGDVCIGAMWPVQQEIYISEELNEEKAMRTIRHELCHAYIAATQANNPETWDEEAICDLVGIYGADIAAKAKEIYLELFEGPMMVLGKQGTSVHGSSGLKSSDTTRRARDPLTGVVVSIDGDDTNEP